MTARASNGLIDLTASEWHGGAISSLIYAGNEFLDNSDNGRLWQTAWQWDGLGELSNPTEGGSTVDLIGQTSSHVFDMSVRDVGNVLHSATGMSEWLTGQATNSYVDHIITVGAGLPNLIHEQTTVWTYEQHQSAGLEIATVYMAPEFIHAWSYDPAAVKLADLQWTPEANGTPFAWTGHAAHDAIIVTNGDGSLAFGLWSPNSGGQYIADYTAAVGHPLLKLDAWAYWDHPVPGQGYHYDVYAAVGGFNDVAAALHHAWELG